MTYKINDTPVIENNGDAKFTQLTVTGGSIFLPDVNPSRNTVGYKLSSQTNIDTAGRGVHAKVTIDVSSPDNYAIVGSNKSSGYAAGGLAEHDASLRFEPGIGSTPFTVGILGSPPFYESSTRIISKFSFSNDSSGVIFNSLTNAVSHSTGARSTTDGYSIGGINLEAYSGPAGLGSIYGPISVLPNAVPSVASRPPFRTSGIVRNFNSRSFMQKFPFSSETLTNTIASPLLGNYGSMGFQSQTRGFKFGGLSYINYSYGWSFTNCNSDMSTFPFATDSVSSTGIVAPTSSAYGGNVNSSEHGYIYGGLFRALWPDSFVDYEVHKTVLKFPYATTTYTVVMPNTYPGNNLLGAMMPAHSSSTHGYVLSGCGSPASPGNIGQRSAFFETGEMRKFSFSSDTSSISIGNLGQNFLERYAYYSSDSNGYVDRKLFPSLTPPVSLSGPSWATVRQRLKFPFATDAVAQETGGVLAFGLAGAVGIEGG